MRQLARLEYFVRHLLTFAPYLTVAKAYNLVLNVLELHLKIERPRSLPPYLKIEPTPLCQMACPGCAHGDREQKRELFHNRRQLRLQEFKQILEPVKHATLGVSLSLRGEPLLGKDLLAMVEHAHACGVAVSFPTNMSVKLSEEKLTRLVTSGVDALYVSLDGASPETYARYRVGGDFHRVLANVGALATIKKRLGRSRPRLIWKFVVFDYNRHEIEAVEQRHRELGFDAYELVEDYDSERAKEQLREHNERLVSGRKGCYWAWHTATVRADGVVAPCCLGHQNFGLGKIQTQSLPEIWRSDAYAALRRGFDTMSPSDLHPVCARCLGVVGSRHDLRDDAPLVSYATSPDS